MTLTRFSLVISSVAIFRDESSARDEQMRSTASLIRSVVDRVVTRPQRCAALPEWDRVVRGSDDVPAIWHSVRKAAPPRRSMGGPVAKLGQFHLRPMRCVAEFSCILSSCILSILSYNHLGGAIIYNGRSHAHFSHPGGHSGASFGDTLSAR